MIVERIEEIIHNIRSNPHIPKDTVVPVYVTGHSLGGALATVVFAAIRGRPLPPNVMLRDLITFGSPRVGDEEFSQSLLTDRTRKTPNLQSSYRIVNKDDVVTSVPGTFWEEPDSAYVHVEQGLRAGIIPGAFETIPADDGAVPSRSKIAVLDILKNVWKAFYRNDGESVQV